MTVKILAVHSASVVVTYLILENYESYFGKAIHKPRQTPRLQLAQEALVRRDSEAQ